MSYKDYRSGLTYGLVAASLREESRRVFEREGRRMFITRHTILGRWRQLKLESYEGYLQNLAEDAA